MCCGFAVRATTLVWYSGPATGPRAPPSAAVSVLSPWSVPSPGITPRLPASVMPRRPLRRAGCSSATAIEGRAEAAHKSRQTRLSGLFAHELLVVPSAPAALWMGTAVAPRGIDATRRREARTSHHRGLLLPPAERLEPLLVFAGHHWVPPLSGTGRHSWWSGMPSYRGVRAGDDPHC